MEASDGKIFNSDKSKFLFRSAFISFSKLSRAFIYLFVKVDCESSENNDDAFLKYYFKLVDLDEVENV